MTGVRAGRPSELNRDEVWAAIIAHRIAVADLLDGLADEDWQRPSLCAGWTVRDVAAHLTLQQLGPAATAGVMLRWRGSLDRMIRDAACRRAGDLSPAQIARQIRATAAARRHNLGVSYLETLTDILVHGQDIALPLGRHLDVPGGPAAVAAGRLLSMRWPPALPSVRAVRDLRLVATDLTWSAGQGPEVRGPMRALLLAVAGRGAALAELAGPGAGELAARLPSAAGA